MASGARDRPRRRLGGGDHGHCDREERDRSGHSRVRPAARGRGIVLGLSPLLCARVLAGAAAVRNGSRAIVKAMQDFRSGQRAGTVMDRIAKGFTDDEIQAIAAWYATQK